MAKKDKHNDGNQGVDLTDKLIGQSFYDEMSKSLFHSQSDSQINFNNLSVSDHSLSFSND